MPKRLTRIYTRSGDGGDTGLADGSRLPKEALRVEAIGAVDELNSLLGVVLAMGVTARLAEVQHDLFELGGNLALPGRSVGGLGERVTWLEGWLDEMNGELAPLEEFILPGGAPAAAYVHLARAVCRRAERRVSALQRRDGDCGEVLRYLNRLSDLLFVLARTLNREAEVADVQWCRRGE